MQNVKHAHREGVHHVPSDIVRKGEAVVLRNRHLLTGKTEVSGQYEHASKSLLLEMGIAPVWYEAITFDITLKAVGGGVRHTYPPDIVTPFFVDGKQVIIELHAENDTSIARGGSFRALHGDRFYYILVSGCIYGPKGFSLEVRDRRSHPDAVDELWRMPKIRTGKGGGYNQYDINLWKQYMRTALIDFLLHRADDDAGTKNLGDKTPRIKVDLNEFDRKAALINVKRE